MECTDFKLTADNVEVITNKKELHDCKGDYSVIAPLGEITHETKKKFAVSAMDYAVEALNSVKVEAMTEAAFGGTKCLSTKVSSSAKVEVAGNAMVKVQGSLVNVMGMLKIG